MSKRPIIEPFRIKSVEPIRTTTREERQRLIEAAGYNLFLVCLGSDTIDLLTDSGTSAMSTEQWAADDARGTNRVRRFAEFCEISRFHPRHLRLSPCDSDSPGAGGGANHLQCDVQKGRPSFQQTRNFDTHRAPTANTSAPVRVDLTIAEAKEPSQIHPFKGTWTRRALPR